MIRMLITAILCSVLVTAQCIGQDRVATIGREVQEGATEPQFDDPFLGIAFFHLRAKGAEERQLARDIENVKTRVKSLLASYDINQSFPLNYYWNDEELCSSILCDDSIWVSSFGERFESRCIGDVGVFEYNVNGASFSPLRIYLPIDGSFVPLRSCSKEDVGAPLDWERAKIAAIAAELSSIESEVWRKFSQRLKSEALIVDHNTDPDLLLMTSRILGAVAHDDE